MTKKTLIKRNKALTHMLLNQIFWTIICLTYIEQNLGVKLTGPSRTIALLIMITSLFSALYVFLDDIDALLSGIIQRHRKKGRRADKMQDQLDRAETDSVDVNSTEPIPNDLMKGGQ